MYCPNDPPQWLWASQFCNMMTGQICRLCLKGTSHLVKDESPPPVLVERYSPTWLLPFFPLFQVVTHPHATMAADVILMQPVQARALRCVYQSAPNRWISPNILPGKRVGGAHILSAIRPPALSDKRMKRNEWVGGGGYLYATRPRPHRSACRCISLTCIPQGG